MRSRSGPRLTPAQDGALLELSHKLDDAGAARVPKWRNWKTIRVLIDEGFIERTRPENVFPPRYRITEAGRRHLERRAGRAL